MRAGDQKLRYNLEWPYVHLNLTTHKVVAPALFLDGRTSTCFMQQLYHHIRVGRVGGEWGGWRPKKI